MKAIQDYYPDASSYCYGCGRLNDKGLHIKSYWEGEQSVAHFTPRPEHIAYPGFVYGGLLASLIDCHGTGTAAAAAARAAGEEMSEDTPFRFVTGALNVSYLRPTPLGARAGTARHGARGEAPQSDCGCGAICRGERLCAR